MTAKHLVCALLLLVPVACGDSGGDQDAGQFMTGDEGPRQRCSDMDEDGYDLYCGTMLDCDDEDPEVLDECFQCMTVKEDCPCEPGTRPIWCNPEDVQTVQNGVSGVIRCEEGTRYCRDGAWSKCEILLQYATFIPDA